MKCNVDVVRIRENSIQLNGWAIGKTPETEITYQVEDGAHQPIGFQYVAPRRDDVSQIYFGRTVEKELGFDIQFPYERGKDYYLIAKGEGRKIRIKYNEELIRKRSSVAHKRMQKIRDLMNMETVRVCLDFWKENGLKALLVKSKHKLQGIDNDYDYGEWYSLTKPTAEELEEQRKKVFDAPVKFSIVIPAFKTPERFLREMLDSVRRQSYQNWELCLSDGSGEDSPIAEILKEYTKKDSRIQVKNNKKQLHISDNTNVALDMATGDYIAFMDHDDLLTPDALYECVAEVNEYPDTELIYTDEDKITMDGEEYFFPHFKSDFNLDMLCTTNYFCHLVVVKKELYQAAGKLDGEYDGAQDYDFVLRCVENTDKIRHIPRVLYHWRACEGSTADSAENKSYIVDAGAKAVRAHYRRMGIEAEVIPTKYPGMYRTKYPVKQTPKVSVIIPNKDHTDDLIKCLRSIRERNTYENIEILVVENNSQKKKTFKDYRRIMHEYPKVKVLYWKGEGFNYPEINQYGIDHAAGEYLLFLNNDTEMIGSDCIKEMLSYCMREDVGAVGARMYYEDGTLQHGGVIIGLGGVAGHAFLGMDGDSPGYFARAQVIHDLSAVTAACMMIKKRVYEEVGGFDPKFAVAFNDVDLCLKIRKAGYLIVYDPYAELIHYESKSRGYEDTEEKIERFNREIKLFQTRWKELLEKGDPYYSPNLTLDHNDFGLNHLAKVERR